MNIKPLFNKVLVEELEVVETSNGTFIIPDSIEESNIRFAKVLSVGPGKYENGQLIKPAVNVNDKIYFPKFAGSEITVDDKKYYVISDTDIIALVE